MVSESIQPLNSIGPADSGREDGPSDPAKRDYIEGREQYKAGNYAQAAAAFHNALKGFEEQGDEQGIANACDRLGDTCLARGEYALALENFQRAKAICEKMEDSFSVLALHKKMALAHRELGELDQALALLFDMVEHYHLTRNPQGVVDTLTATAEVYIAQGKPDKAADAYRTISSIHRNFRHRRLAEEFACKAEALEQQ